MTFLVGCAPTRQVVSAPPTTFKQYEHDLAQSDRRCGDGRACLTYSLRWPQGTRVSIDTEVQNSPTRLTVSAASDSLETHALKVTPAAGQKTHHEWIADDWGWLRILIEGEPDRPVGRTRITVGPPPSEEVVPPPALTEEQVADRAAQRERAGSEARASARATLLDGYTLRLNVEQLDVERPLSLRLLPGKCYLWNFSAAGDGALELRIRDARTETSSRIGELSGLYGDPKFCPVRVVTAWVSWPKGITTPTTPYRIELWEKGIAPEFLRRLTDHDRQTGCRDCRERAVVCFQRGDSGCERELRMCIEDHGLRRDACN